MSASFITDGQIYLESLHVAIEFLLWTLLLINRNSFRSCRQHKSFEIRKPSTGSNSDCDGRGSSHNLLNSCDNCSPHEESVAQDNAPSNDREDK